jgi:carbonic anhydrase
MSCPKATAPIDINKSKVIGKCDYKCQYSFNYNDSSCVAINRGDYISVAYDRSSSQPVTYNSLLYDVKEVRIYSPSLHSYMGEKTDGEIIIVHTSASGANPLLVCVPIKVGITDSLGSHYLSTIVNAVTKNAPAEKEKTTVNISRFNLNQFVPRKPFYSYTATEPYQPCSSSNHEYIVFSLSDGSVSITQDTLSRFKSIISKSTYTIKTGPSLFYNEKGPAATSNSDGQIYIDCQPVGKSEDKILVTNDTSTYTFDAGNIMYDKFFQMFLGSLIFIVIVYLIKIGLESYGAKKGGSAVNNLTTSINTMMGGRQYR